MARNRTAFFRRWRPGAPPAEYATGWLRSTFESLVAVTDAALEALEGGPIPGQTISFSFGPLSVDNSGGGAPLTITNGARFVVESAFEPVYFMAASADVTGANATAFVVDLVTGATLASVTLVVGAAANTFVDNSSSFAQAEVSRQTAMAFGVTVPAGATISRLCWRLVGTRPGRIPDTGTTGTLGR